MTQNPYGGAWTGRSASVEIGVSETGKLETFVLDKMSPKSVLAPWLLTQINTDGLYRSTKPERARWSSAEKR